MKFKLIWYDMDGEKATDIIETEKDDQEEARRLGYLKYNGNPPAELVTIMKVEG